MDTSVHPVYFVSDGTGITAETLGNSLLTQFDGSFDKHRRPFVASLADAQSVLREIHEQATIQATPITFLTVMDPAIRRSLLDAPGIVVDLVEGGLHHLEVGLGQVARREHGRAHGIHNQDLYRDRMAAVEFALEHDDGQSERALGLADIILIGPSRCGKTPTSMYLAVHHGVRAANYPLLDEDFLHQQLPEPLRAHTRKLFGLVSSPAHLHAVREERRPGSPYASLEQCRFEIATMQKLCESAGIRHLDTSARSIEEISTIILRHLEAGASTKA